MHEPSVLLNFMSMNMCVRSGWGTNVSTDEDVAGNAILLKLEKVMMNEGNWTWSLLLCAWRMSRLLLRTFSCDGAVFQVGTVGSCLEMSMDEVLGYLNWTWGNCDEEDGRTSNIFVLVLVSLLPFQMAWFHTKSYYHWRRTTKTELAVEDISTFTGVKKTATDLMWWIVWSRLTMKEIHLVLDMLLGFLRKERTDYFGAKSSSILGFIRASPSSACSKEFQMTFL